jgi:hypothetical protein
MVAKVEEAVSFSWTMYSVRAEPPLDEGASQNNETWALEEVPVNVCGAVGAVATETVVVAVVVPLLLTAVKV